LSAGYNVSVIAYHLIWTAYGTWLPNDPRGSGSHSVYAPELVKLGTLHHGRKKIQPYRSEVRAFYVSAEEHLDFPVVRFDSQQRDSIGSAFNELVIEHKYTCYACAIMPDHVHLVIRKHRDDAEQMIGNLQGASRTWLRNNGVVDEEHPVWTRNGWKVFLNSPEEVWSRIQYVSANPEKEGLSTQKWPFVVEYDNWPFHKRK
jgi:REP element-mobilizing transposase RayT